MSRKNHITYRCAKAEDYERVIAFVDFWLSGRAKAKGIEGGGNDYFVTRQQHRSYFKNSHILLAETKGNVVGWGVKTVKNVLIHLLIDARERGRGIGKEMLERLDPDIIRSKSDQITGDPGPFYEKYGYVHIAERKVGSKRNIDLMIKGRA